MFTPFRLSFSLQYPMTKVLGRTTVVVMHLIITAQVMYLLGVFR